MCGKFHSAGFWVLADKIARRWKPCSLNAEVKSLIFNCDECRARSRSQVVRIKSINFVTFSKPRTKARYKFSKSPTPAEVCSPRAPSCAANTTSCLSFLDQQLASAKAFSFSGVSSPSAVFIVLRKAVPTAASNNSTSTSNQAGFGVVANNGSQFRHGFNEADKLGRYRPGFSE